MASIGHVAVGMAGARLFRAGGVPRLTTWSSYVLWSGLSLLPDADVLGMHFGVAYAAPWGHRGATHSFVFALAIGIVVGLLAQTFSLAPLKSGLFAACVVASHPLLDTLTDGGLGCALLWPFDHTRYFAPVTPIPVAPLGRALLSLGALRVALVELVLFGPLFAYALWPRRTRT